jgi:hypothetical protein
VSVGVSGEGRRPIHCTFGIRDARRRALPQQRRPGQPPLLCASWEHAPSVPASRNSSRRGRASRQEKGAAQGPRFRTDSAPDGDTLIHTGNRGVSDPLGARGTDSSRRAGVGHATVPFSVFTRRCGRGGTNESRGPAIRHEKKAQRRARIFRTDGAPDGGTLTHSGNRGVNDPCGRAGRVRRADAGSLTPRFLPRPIGTVAGAAQNATPPMARPCSQVADTSARCLSCSRWDHIEPGGSRFSCG